MVDLLLERGIGRARHRQPGRRAEREPRPPQGQPRSRARASATSATLEPGDPLFAGADYVFHFAGIGDIVPSIERPHRVHVGQRAGHGARARSRAGRRQPEEVRLCGLVLLLRPAPSTPTREDHPIRPQYPYALSKYQGEQAVLHWHKVYKLPANSIRIFNAYGIRSRTSGAYGAVFGVFLRQKLAGKPFTVVGDGTQRRDFVYASDVATAFLAAAETPDRRTRLERRRRQSAVRQPPGRAARRRRPSTSRSGRASPTAPGPTSRGSRPSSAGSPKSPSRKAWRDRSPTSTTGARRRCGTRSRSPRRPRPGSRCFLPSAEGKVPSIDAKYKAKIKTDRRAASPPSARARASARSSCATAPSTSCIRATSAT